MYCYQVHYCYDYCHSREDECLEVVCVDSDRVDLLSGDGLHLPPAGLYENKRKGHGMSRTCRHGLIFSNQRLNHSRQAFIGTIYLFILCFLFIPFPFFLFLFLLHCGINLYNFLTHAGLSYKTNTAAYRHL